MVALNPRGRRGHGPHGPRRRHRAETARLLDEPLAGLDAERAHLLGMAGDVEAAVTHYSAAASRTTSLPEQHYLTTKADRLARSR